MGIGVSEEGIAGAGGDLSGVVVRHGPAHRAQHGTQLVADLGHGGQRQVLHVAEVAIESVGVQPRLARQLPQAEAGEAAPGCGQAQRCVDQFAFAAGNVFHGVRQKVEAGIRRRE